MTSVTALFNMLSQFFNWKTTKRNKQIETDVLNAKLNLKRACVWAEEAFLLVEKYAKIENEKIEKRVKKAIKKFRELN